MKVIHLISGGDTGGAKTHVHTLLQGLNQHIQADMVCFTDGPFVEEARELGIQVDVLGARNPLAVLNALRKKIQQEGYQIIHCHGSRANLIGSLLKRSTGLPVVTTVHSDPKLDYMGRPLSALTYGVLNAWALRRIPYHIGVSEPMVELLIDRGFDPQKVFVIRNGLDFSNPTSKLNRKEFLDSLGLHWSEDCVIAGIAARLNPVKDMGTLLRGFAAAHSEQPKLRLIIAGDGEEGPMLRQLAKELGVEQEVCFAGWLSDTPSFYHAIDINTLTSLSEGFPYALPEGARFALPTVATQVGGVPSFIEHDVTGYLFQPRDHAALAKYLAALCADPALRRRLGDKLLERGRKDYSIESTISLQLHIYESVLRLHARKNKKRDGVVICGAYGQNNTGDEAVLKAVLAELRAIDPDMPLCVMTRTPKQARQTYRTNAVYTFNVPSCCRRRLADSGRHQPAFPVVLSVYPHRRPLDGQPRDDVRLRHRTHSARPQPPPVRQNHQPHRRHRHIAGQRVVGGAALDGRQQAPSGAGSRPCRHPLPRPRGDRQRHPPKSRAEARRGPALSGRHRPALARFRA